MADAAPATPAAETAPAEAAPETAPAAEAPKPEAPAAPKSWKLEMPQGELVVEDPEELYALAQQGISAAKMLQQAKAEAAQAAEFKRRLKEDPIGLLRDPAVGANAKEVALKLLREQMEEENLTPEQKELREYKRKLEAFESDKKKQAEEAERVKMEAAQKEAREHFVKVISDAVDATSLPKTDAVARRVAGLMLRNMELGLELPATAIAKLVEQEYEEEHAALYGAMDPKKLQKKFPKLADSLRRAQLEELNAAPPAPAEMPAENEQPIKPRGPGGARGEKIDFREAQRRIMENLKRK